MAIIKEECVEFKSLEEISKKVNKSTAHLKNRIIPAMIKLGLLEKEFQDNNPKQRYRTK